MADWIHCNKCFARFRSNIKFHITECLHIHCENCYSKLSINGDCLVCGAEKPNTVLISKNMPEDIKVFFMPVETQLAKLQQVIIFQRRNQEMLSQYKYNFAKKEALKFHQISCDLKKENFRVKDLLRTTYTSRSNYSSSTLGAGPHPAGNNSFDMSMSSGGFPQNPNSGGSSLPGYPRRMMHPHREMPYGSLGSDHRPSPMQTVPVHVNHPDKSRRSGMFASMKDLNLQH